MNISPSKENILKRIRKALTHSTPLPYPQSEGNQPIYPAFTQEPEVEFAEQFTRLQGKFIYCINRQEYAFQLASLVRKQEWTKLYCVEPECISGLSDQVTDITSQSDLEGCDAAITGCEFLVARTGTIVMSAAQLGGRTASVFAPVHICVAYTHQVVPDIKDALQGARDRYGAKLPSLITFATGPSRTADIEKTLVVGVHGPREVYVFLLEG